MLIVSKFSILSYNISKIYIRITHAYARIILFIRKFSFRFVKRMNTLGRRKIIPLHSMIHFILSLHSQCTIGLNTNAILYTYLYAIKAFDVCYRV